MSPATPEPPTTHAVQDSSQPVAATPGESAPINTEPAISAASSPPLTAVAEPAQPETLSTDAPIPQISPPTEEKVMTATELTHVAPEATQLAQTPLTSETHLAEHDEEAEEAQNDLTQKFTELEWKALKKLRVSIHLCVVLFQKRAC